MAGQVYRRDGEDTIVSVYVPPRQANTPVQVASRVRLEVAVAAWQSLTPEARERWRRWAATRVTVSPRTGSRRAPRADNLFRGLGAKYLQLHGGYECPTEPPTSEFLGDGIVIVAQASPLAKAGDATEGESLRLAGTQARAVPGALFLASGPNADGVVTELLAQRLGAAWHQPRPNDYRTQAFVAFTSEGREAFAPLRPGAWALAVRFVRADTGQMSRLVPLVLVEVG